MNEATKQINHKLSEFASQFDAALNIGLPVNIGECDILKCPIWKFSSDPICIEDARLHEKLMDNAKEILLSLCGRIRIDLDQHEFKSIVGARAHWINIFDSDQIPNENIGYFAIKLLVNNQ
jgi:hypothetical protein